MKDRMVWLMIMVIGLAGVAGAETVLLVSDEPVSGGRDDSLVAWLTSIGYTVDTSGMNKNFREGGTSPWGAGNEAKLDALNAADLIFVSRSTSSGGYNDDRKGWNELGTPLLLNGNIALTRGETDGERWGWAPDNDSGDDDDTFWVMTDGSPNLEMWDWTGSPVSGLAPKDIGRMRDYDQWDGPIGYVDNVTGTLIFALHSCSTGQTRGVWVEFPVGTDFDAGQVPPIVPPIKYGTTTAMRVFFTCVSYDDTGLGPGGTDGDWSDYQLPLYKTTLAGVIEELTGGGDPSYNPPPSANAGPDQSVYPEDLPVQLAGTASDEGSSDGTSAGWPEGVQSVSWHQESSSTGGTATFTAASPPSGDPIADILNSTVDFDIPGIYELVLTATDIEPKDANDVVVIALRDHADDLLIGHWEMEDNLLDTSTNSNDGTHYAYQQALPPATFADGAIGRALVLDNPNRTDPNVAYVYLGDAPELDIQTVGPEFTVTAWFKTTNGNDQVIIGKGGDTGGGIRWLLMVDSGRVRFLTDDDKARIRPRGSRYSDDGVWHFAVGVSDGYNQELRVYVDGVLTDSDDLPAGYDISGSSQRPGLIGAGTDDNHTEPTEVNDKIFDGLIDDVRVYNYALPLDDPTYLDILDLAVMGELLVMVDAGPDVARQLQPGESITLAGVVTDNGMGTGTPTNFKWETVSHPLPSEIADANAIFVDDTSLTTSVQFPLFGFYTLRLSADDENLGTTVSDEVTIEVISPDCTDVIAADRLLAGDISGPDGTPDCRVDLYDIAEFAANFGRCNDPQAECEDAWGGG